MTRAQRETTVAIRAQHEAEMPGHVLKVRESANGHVNVLCMNDGEHWIVLQDGAVTTMNPKTRPRVISNIG